MTERSIGELAAGITNKLAEQTGRVRQFPQQESVMSETVDHYSKWEAMLRGEKPIIHESEPLCGFWRTRRSKTDKELIGVAVWPGDNGELVALLGKSIVPMERVWPYYAKNPVSEEAYRAWEQTGNWPDDHPIAAPAAPGNNEPADPVDMLRDQIESAKAGVSDYAKIQSDEQAAQAQSLRSRLLELSREADKMREAEKRPHLEAGKEVDAKFQPLVKDAKAGADDLARSMSKWETDKAKAAALADARRREQEEAARRAAEAGKPAPEPALDLEPKPPAGPATTQVRGAYGRAAAVKVVNVVTGISDFDALVKHYRPAVEVFLSERAQRDVNAGFTVPGITTEEQRKVA